MTRIFASFAASLAFVGTATFAFAHAQLEKAAPAVRVAVMARVFKPAIDTEAEPWGERENGVGAAGCSFVTASTVTQSPYQTV